MTPTSAKETAAKYKAEADYEVIDENPWWFNGTGMINKKRCGLFICNVKTGEVKMITPANFRVGDYCEKTGLSTTPARSTPKKWRMFISYTPMTQKPAGQSS